MNAHIGRALLCASFSAAAATLSACSGIGHAIDGAVAKANGSVIDGITCQSGVGTLSGAGVSGDYTLYPANPNGCVGDTSLVASLAAPSGIPAYAPTAPMTVHLYIDGAVKSGSSFVDLGSLSALLPAAAIGQAKTFELFEYGAVGATATNAWTDTGYSATVSSGMMASFAASSTSQQMLPFLAGGSKNAQRIGLAFVGDK